MSGQNAASAVESLLKQLAADGASAAPRDIATLADALAPKSSKSDRSVAFLCLSKLAEQHKESEGKDNDALLGLLQPYVESVFNLGDTAVEPDHFIPVTSLLSSLFPLASATAVSVLTTTRGSGDDAFDALAILLDSAELSSDLQPALADMLANAAGTKPGRQLVRARGEEWLRGAVNYSQGDSNLGALCAVALSKLGREARPEQGEPMDENQQLLEEVALCKKMMDHITSNSNTTGVLPTLEGLSILSLKGPIKHLLVTDDAFVKKLLALSPIPTRAGSLPVTPRASMDVNEDKLFEPIETSLCYGLTTILGNLTARKPALSAEDEQIAKLRAMAISGKKGGGEVKEDPFEHEDAVKVRIKELMRDGVVGALSGLVRAQSQLVKEGLGRLCLNLVEDKSNRPIFIRDGGFRVLSLTIRDLLDPPSGVVKPETPPDLLSALQALAKLVITTPPHLLFPPPHLTTSLNALSPLYHLLAHPSSTLLQQFEALMALTNLASIDSSIAQKMVTASVAPPSIDNMWRSSGREDKVTIMSFTEGLLLDANDLVRRAATELVCNITASPAGFAHFTGEGEGSAPTAKVISRLDVLLVLTTVDDMQTRLAAGGALAVATESPAACQALLSIPDYVSARRSTWARISSLYDADDESEEEDGDGEAIPVIFTAEANPELVHRATIILFNLLQHVSSQEESEKKELLEDITVTSLEDRLMGVVRGSKRREILEPAVECLKLLKKL